MTSDQPRPSGGAADNSRSSLHVEPRSLREVGHHYIRDLVYGANDGIITTFAVVAGVSGGALSPRAVLIVGAANLFADGLSMGVGNYLGIRADEGSRSVQGLPELEAQPARHGTATFAAFVAAGILPLVPFVMPGLGADGFFWSATVTLASLFGVGAARSAFTVEPWWRTGSEMLGLGVVVAGAAYFAGALAAHIIGRTGLLP